jgi:hypothetical protein
VIAARPSFACLGAYHTHSPRLPVPCRVLRPVWNEDEANVTGFVSRLQDDVERPGFVAAIARRDGRRVGFAAA